MTGAERRSWHELDSDDPALAGRSYLLVDCGHSACTMTLYDLVEGRYRLVGRGVGLNTAGPPWFDISHGLQQALGQLSEANGRKLMTAQGQLVRPTRSDGNGVDYFGATVSLGRPLRVIVAGLLESASIASARSALQAVYAQEVDCFSLADSRGRPGQIEALLAKKPDAVLLVGGTDGGADRQVLAMATTLAMALELQEEIDRPVLIYGGNAYLRPAIQESLVGLTDVRLVDNVRPSYEVERIGHAIAMLAEVQYATKVAADGSTLVLSDWCNAAPMNSAHAFGGIAEYLAAAVSGRVLGLDVGSGQVTLLSAVEGKVDLAVRSDLGLGQPMPTLFDGRLSGDRTTGSGDNGLDPALADYAMNKSTHPNILPMTKGAVRAELEIAGQMIRRIAADVATDWSWPARGGAPECDLLLVRGRVFTNAPDVGGALVGLLEALRPQGVFRVMADPYGVLPAMGLLAGEDPDMVVQILSGDALERWAWVAVPVGRGQPGETALTVSVQTEASEIIKEAIPFGHLEIVPLPSSEAVKIDLQPAPGFDVGAGPGKSRQLRMAGGRVGLVLDCRDRTSKGSD